MATIFPLSPTIDQEYNGYKWNGTAWKLLAPDLNSVIMTVKFDDYQEVLDGKVFYSNYS